MAEKLVVQEAVEWFRKDYQAGKNDAVAPDGQLEEGLVEPGLGQGEQDLVHHLQSRGLDPLDGDRFLAI